MSEVKVNKISPRSGTTVTLGDSGDTFTIPSGATITNSGTAAGFGSTGEISWDTTPKTGDFTGVSGVGYFINSGSGAVIVTLPGSPSAGNVIGVADYNSTAATNAITINRNSNKINGTTSNLTISKSNSAIQLVYIDATTGWQSIFTGNTSDITNTALIATGGTVTTCGNCKIHTFTGPGTFTVTNAASGGCAPSNDVSYIVVAGGGGGGTGDGGGGGGGAGGYREVVSPSAPYTGSPLDGYPSAPNRITVTAQAYSIVVGAGGNGAGGAIPSPSAGTNGGVSTFSTITSAGGGAGGNYGGGLPSSCGVGKNGGSGGAGTSEAGAPNPSAGGSGNTPPTTPAQGQDGGGGKGNTGGGGGGAGGAGQTAPGPTQGGNGGVGVPTGINPSTCVGTPGPAPGRYFAGGGGGNNEGPGGAPNQGTGGAGGGAAGDAPGNSGNAGTVNTGGAGGGMDSNPSHPTATHNGGSGIVIIRYKFQ